MPKRVLLPLVGIFLLSLSLSACQVATPTPAITPSATPMTPTASGGRVIVVTATPTQGVFITSTPLPPTATPVIVTATPPSSPAATPTGGTSAAATPTSGTSAAATPTR